jgi:hypothetical protein
VLFPLVKQIRSRRESIEIVAIETSTSRFVQEENPKAIELDHPHSPYFKTSFKMEYSVLVIDILSFIFNSPALIFL